MAHSDHHLFAHLPANTHTHSAITAAEVPALHFDKILGWLFSKESARGKGVRQINHEGVI